MTKLAPEWVRTSDPLIRSPARYHWTTAPALYTYIYIYIYIYIYTHTHTHIYVNDIYMWRSRAEYVCRVVYYWVQCVIVRVTCGARSVHSATSTSVQKAGTS